MKLLVCILAFVAGCAGAQYYDLNKCQKACSLKGLPEAAYVSIENATPTDRCACYKNYKDMIEGKEVK